MCMYTCIHVYMFVCRANRVHIYIRMNVCMYMYACMYVCMYAGLAVCYVHIGHCMCSTVLPAWCAPPLCTGTV